MPFKTSFFSSWQKELKYFSPAVHLLESNFAQLIHLCWSVEKAMFGFLHSSFLHTVPVLIVSLSTHNFWKPWYKADMILSFSIVPEVVIIKINDNCAFSSFCSLPNLINLRHTRTFFSKINAT